MGQSSAQKLVSPLCVKDLVWTPGSAAHSCLGSSLWNAVFLLFLPPLFLPRILLASSLFSFFHLDKWSSDCWHLDSCEPGDAACGNPTLEGGLELEIRAGRRKKSVKSVFPGKL